VADTFEEYRKKLDLMRSIDNGREVAEFMMVLSLNELGKAFLAVDEFLPKKRPYSGAMPADQSKGAGKKKRIMKKIKLSSSVGETTQQTEGYELDPDEQYVINPRGRAGMPVHIVGVLPNHGPAAGDKELSRLAL
jgi:hypothetical protein